MKKFIFLFEPAQNCNCIFWGRLIHEYWLDIGRVDDLNRANRDFQQVFGR